MNKIHLHKPKLFTFTSDARYGVHHAKCTLPRGAQNFQWRCGTVQGKLVLRGAPHGSSTDQDLGMFGHTFGPSESPIGGSPVGSGRRCGVPMGILFRGWSDSHESGCGATWSHVLLCAALHHPAWTTVVDVLRVHRMYLKIYWWLCQLQLKGSAPNGPFWIGFHGVPNWSNVFITTSWPVVLKTFLFMCHRATSLLLKLSIPSKDCLVWRQTDSGPSINSKAATKERSCRFWKFRFNILFDNVRFLLSCPRHCWQLRQTLVLLCDVMRKSWLTSVQIWCASHKNCANY